MFVGRPCPGLFGQQVAAAGGGDPTITSTEVTTGTTHNISLGPTVASGDLLFLFAASTIAWVAPSTAASGWVWMKNFNNDSSGAVIFRKVADGSEGGTTINVTTGATAAVTAQVFRIQTWTGNTADIASAATSGYGFNDATAESPALTTGFGSVSTLWMCGVASAHATTLSSGPTNYTTTEAGTVGTTRAQMRTGYRLLTASAETPGVMTFSGGTNWSSHTIAVRIS